MESISEKVPFFSIVIPTYNRREKLLKAVKSVLNQSYKEFELIIIDDGSGDETSEAIKKIDDTRIKFIVHEQSKGANAARNIGINLARGKYISFLDSDDLFLKHKLRRIYEEIMRNPECSIFLSSYIKVKKKRETINFQPNLRLTPKQFRNLLCYYLIDPSTSGLVINRNVLLKHNGFNENLKRMQDRELLLRLSNKKGCTVIDDILWKKYWSDDGISSYINGYISALLPVLDTHKYFEKEYQKAFHYLIFRTLFRQLKSGQIFSVAKDIRILSGSNKLPTNIARLYMNYLLVKKIRRNYSAEKRKIRLRKEYNQIVNNTEDDCEGYFIEFKSKFPSIF